MLGGLPGLPSTLSLLRPPSYEQEPETYARAMTTDETMAAENLILEKLWANEGKQVSRTDLLIAAGDKNDRKGVSHILDELVRKHPEGGDMGGIKVHQTKRGNTFRYHYSWVSPDAKGESDNDQHDS
jgi:hypothetical protein